MNSGFKHIIWPVVVIAKFIGKHNPKLIVKIRYFLRFKRRLNLVNPRTLNEKILFQSLCCNDSLQMRSLLSDKWRVREYVRDCGLGYILVTSYGVWNDAFDIDFPNLPNQFVLKPNNGCGDIIIVQNKNDLDFDKIKKTLCKSLNTIYGELEGGIHYYGIRPLVFAEEMLFNDVVSSQYSSSLIDYKIWCFNGIAYYTMTCTNRNGDSVELQLYDRDWNEHPEYMCYNEEHLRGECIPEPIKYYEMLKIAEKLASPFPVVRVDLYNLNGKIYFGEMTFTSLGGMMTYYSDEFQLLAGSLIKL